MTLLRTAQEIEIERELITAILDSALRHPGAAQLLAKRVGISTVHLSYVRRGKRLARMDTAVRIAHGLPVPREQQDEWVYHIERVWSLKRYVRKRFLRLARDVPVDQLVEEIKEAHGTATFAREPTIAKSNYRIVKTLAGHLLEYVEPNQDPVNYIELAFLMHEALCVMNRNDQALWYAKRARWIAQSMDDPRAYGTTRERLDFFQVNSLRAEAVALYNLKLYREAVDICEEAEATDAMKRNEKSCKPHLYRDWINAIKETPRFSITQVENLAEQVQQICDARRDAFDPLLSFLISTSLARAYINHANFKDAFRVLSSWFNRLDTTAHVGPLHKASFWRTCARLYSQQGDYGDEWKYFARQAVQIASAAGLEHQLQGIRAESGTHFAEIALEE